MSPRIPDRPLPANPADWIMARSIEAAPRAPQMAANPSATPQLPADDGWPLRPGANGERVNIAVRIRSAPPRKRYGPDKGDVNGKSGPAGPEDGCQRMGGTRTGPARPRRIPPIQEGNPPNVAVRIGSVPAADTADRIKSLEAKPDGRMNIPGAPALSATLSGAPRSPASDGWSPCRAGSA